MGHILSKNGIKVYVGNLAMNVDFDILKQVIENNDLVIGDKCQIFFANTQGMSYVIESNKLKVFYAKKNGADLYSPMTMQGMPILSKQITVYLTWSKTDIVDIVDAFWGAIPPLCQEMHADRKAFVFWQNHAFYTRRSEFQEDTYTEVCPWAGYLIMYLKSENKPVIMSMAKVNEYAKVNGLTFTITNKESDGELRDNDNNIIAYCNLLQYFS